MAPRSDAASISRSSATASPATPCAAASPTPAASSCRRRSGTLYTPNITPDPETGIGKWTADDFRRAMHEGISKDGSYLYPAFPYNNYTRVTRADVDAIYAFFMSLPPVSQPNKPHEMRFPYNQRQLLLGWRTLYFKAGEFKPNPGESAEWNRGAYLVEGLGHCNACHGTRNMLGAVKDDDVGGGLIPVQNWYAPSLTSNRETGLGDWQSEGHRRPAAHRRVRARRGVRTDVRRRRAQPAERHPRRPDRDVRLPQGAGGEGGAGRSGAGAAERAAGRARC